MRVTLVTTWDIPCGIAEHAYYFVEALHAADPAIRVNVEPNLHPDACVFRPEDAPDWIWLNYHAALHSLWTPTHVLQAQTYGMKVGITYHDTGVPNSDQCTALHAVADCFVVHESAEDLPGAVYLRQGIPAGIPYLSFLVAGLRKAYPAQPLVGTLGFPFPWKNYDLLAEASALAGWALLLLAPNATDEQIAKWYALNPNTKVVRGFTPREEALSALSACDATAFLYANANTGTSAAIRQGIAARKPVIASAYAANRQNRDLWLDPIAGDAISWLESLTVESVAGALTCVQPGPFDAGIVRLAEQDSWAKAGQVYARLLRERL